MKFIHDTAIVQTLDIGEQTSVWQFSVILEKASIGRNCNINAHTFIENDVIIGNNVTVKCGVYLWNGIIIKDNVFIGPNATFTNDINPRSKNYKDPVRTIVEEGASIGANATIKAGINIGEYAMIGMGAVVTKNVPPFALVYGNPAKICGWVNLEGERLKTGESVHWTSKQGTTHLVTSEGIKEV